MPTKTWFITGASAGFGRILTEKLLAQGQNVVATARKPETLADLKDQFTNQIITPALDVTNQSQIDLAVKEAIQAFGKIDVLVNNAGYGFVGTIEEITDAEARAQFDTNVFGLLNVSRPIIGHMREQNSGHILNISSIAGLVASATFPIYAASKHAVEAISEGLAASVKEFGIKVTLIEPGAFNTRFKESASIRITENRIAAYNEQMEATFSWLHNPSAIPPGDPEKACDAMIAITQEENPPLRLILGEDALIRAMGKLESVKAEFDRFKHVSISTSYDQK